MKDRYVAVLVHLLDGGHRRVKANLVVQPQNIFIGHAHHGAVVAVQGVGMRNDRVQVVVATGELQNNDYGFFFNLGSDVWSPWL